MVRYLIPDIAIRIQIDSMLFERSALSRKPEELLQQELNNLKSAGAVTPDKLCKELALSRFFPVPLPYLNRESKSCGLFSIILSCPASGCIGLIR